jgi:hypothetical protein
VFLTIEKAKHYHTSLIRIYTPWLMVASMTILMMLMMKKSSLKKE